MMTDCKPGTVAVATVRGVPNVRVFRFRDVYGRPRWDAAEPIDHLATWPDEHVIDVRPLVVLDLDAGEVHGLVDVLHRSADGLSPTHPGLCRKVARQIEAQIPSPRIPEPGLWGVVAADGQGLDDVHWVRTKADPPWVAVSHGRYAEWQQLIDPVLIRDGIEES